MAMIDKERIIPGTVLHLTSTLSESWSIDEDAINRSIKCELMITHASFEDVRQQE